MKKKYQNIHQQLIDRCKHNDGKAQMEIYRLYYKAMYNASYRIVNDEQEAEDIMQEAFLSAFEKIETYKGEVSFGAWLKKIVINRSLDELKKRKVQFQPVDEIGEISDETDETDMDFENEIREVRKAVEALPEGYRIVLSLYLLEGYDHDEIAQILNITNSTSRSKFKREKKKLLEILKEKKRETNERY